MFDPDNLYEHVPFPCVYQQYPVTIPLLLKGNTLSCRLILTLGTEADLTRRASTVDGLT
jgi:hypothetical protein